MKFSNFVPSGLFFAVVVVLQLEDNFKHLQTYIVVFLTAHTSVILEIKSMGNNIKHEGRILFSGPFHNIMQVIILVWSSLRFSKSGQWPCSQYIQMSVIYLSKL